MISQQGHATKFEFNFYDLDINKTLKIELPFALKHEPIVDPKFDKDVLLGNAWRLVEIYCRELGLDYDYHLKSSAMTPLIIHSSHYLYFNFLDWALMFYDPFLIKHFLDYQIANFRGNRDAKNRDEYLGKVMFLAYDIVKSYSPNNNLLRREKIIDWLESQNANDLPLRFSKRGAVIEDKRYKGKLSPHEVRLFWLRLTNYTYNGDDAEVLSELEINQFLHANFWGFDPQRPIEKLNVRFIPQVEFNRFCKSFFDVYSDSARTSGFIKIMKANFSIFDKTSEESMVKNFSK